MPKIQLYCKHCKGPAWGHGPTCGDGYTISQHQNAEGKECVGSFTSARPLAEGSDNCKEQEKDGCTFL